MSEAPFCDMEANLFTLELCYWADGTSPSSSISLLLKQAVFVACGQKYWTGLHIYPHACASLCVGRGSKVNPRGPSSMQSQCSVCNNRKSIGPKRRNLFFFLSQALHPSISVFSAVVVYPFSFFAVVSTVSLSFSWKCWAALNVTLAMESFAGQGMIMLSELDWGV